MVPESADISWVKLIFSNESHRAPTRTPCLALNSCFVFLPLLFSLSLPFLVDEGSSVLLEVLRTSHFVCPSACVCVCVCMLDQINVCVCVYMWGMEGGLGSCSVFCPSLSLIFSPFPNQLHSVPVLPLCIEKRQRDWEVWGDWEFPLPPFILNQGCSLPR